MGEGALARAKKNLGLKGTVVFIDETGFSERPPLRRTWGPRGETPVVAVRGRCWKRVSAIGALSYRLDGSESRVFLCMHDDTIRTLQVRRFVSHLHRHLEGPVLLIWDGLNAHRALAVRQRIAAYGWQAERLPAYAPELNPVEGLWSWTKGVALANRGREDIGLLMDAVRRATRRVRRLPSVLRGLLAKASLSL